jgi:hypothetical protein
VVIGDYERRDPWPPRPPCRGGPGETLGLTEPLLFPGSLLSEWQVLCPVCSEELD